MILENPMRKTEEFSMSQFSRVDENLWWMEWISQQTGGGKKSITRTGKIKNWFNTG